MKIIYDPNKDILQISLIQGPVEETTQISPGLVLDYDEDGHVMGLELRKASKRVENPYAIAYQVGEADMTKPKPKVTEVEE
ncbi:MAG: DUF2283 domain-containing protein [Merismopedia sp. SIO2A8]|nr:DUF2283 domain-containing protein [Symploca sp. SIO2B6]NET49028.1 DUF2283 domain-containing protein [Merismopedia sp. SIO2A8]